MIDILGEEPIDPFGDGGLDNPHRRSDGNISISSELILSYLSSAISSAEFNIPAKKFLVFYIPPMFTVEAHLGGCGKLMKCCTKDGKSGVMAEGNFGMSISTGVGSIIGGSAGTKIGKSGKTYHDTGSGRFKPNPFLSKNHNSSAFLGLPFSKTPCETTLEFKFELNVNLKAEGLFTSVTGQFPIGSCSIPGQCNWNFDPKINMALGSYGAGARAEVEGKATGTGKGHIYTF